MFLGKFVCTVDDNGRLELPKALLSALGEEIVITQGFDQNLIILPAQTFSHLAGQVTLLTKTDPLVRMLARLLLGQASLITLDSHGRVTLPETLRTLCNITGQAVLVGSGDLLEVWSPHAWQSQQEALLAASHNPHHFSALNLCLRA